MSQARLFAIAFAIGITAWPRAGELPEFIVQTWLAEAERDPKKPVEKTKLPLGTPVYVPHDTFKPNYYTNWLNRPGVDLLTPAGLRLRLGESNGIDLSDSIRGTNRPVEEFPIPKNVPGVFFRFRAATNANPISLTCEFVYNSKDDEKSPVRRVEHFTGTLNFRSNEVAIIRLPQTTHTLRPQRTILGIPAGRGKQILAREFYLAVKVSPTTNQASVR